MFLRPSGRRPAPRARAAGAAATAAVATLLLPGCSTSTSGDPASDALACTVHA